MEKHVDFMQKQIFVRKDSDCEVYRRIFKGKEEGHFASEMTLQGKYAEKKIKIGIVGVSFGMEFVPIYQKHPYVESTLRLYHSYGDEY